MHKLEREIARRISDYERPKRVALSRKYPILKKPAIFFHHTIRNVQNFLDPRIHYTKQTEYFPSIVARHQSVLRRKLGDSDLRLQEQKVKNLQQALKCLNGVIIRPGDVFSLWDIIGKPNYENGYVDGMLLSDGRVIEGVGGGLCQLSNFLYWIFLHAPVETIERYHHSMDVFPDSGRTLPFGGGATILYNFIDLKVKNISTQPLQLKLWLTNDHLKGQILAPSSTPQKFHVFEKNHYFIKRGKRYFRYNQIYRETTVHGKVKKTERMITNFAPVLYRITPQYLKEHRFNVLDFTDISLDKPSRFPI